MAKAKNKIKVSFIGEACMSGVTGSSILIEMSGKKIIVEDGLFQSNNIRKDNQINAMKYPYKVRDIDYIFLLHTHADHIGRVCKQYAEGSNATIITPQGLSDLCKIMWLDSCHIFKKDIETLKRKYKMNLSPIYDESDVHEALEHFQEYEIEKKIKIDESITFRFVSSGHIIKSTSLELWLTENGSTKKIYISSDIGSNIPKYYTDKLHFVNQANLAILESTYSDMSRNVTIKDRKKDLEKLETVVRNTCFEKKGKVLIPSFSLDRMQNIVSFLYDIFGNDENFPYKVLIDSPLSAKLNEVYLKLLEGEQLEKFKEVLAWKNLVVVGDYTDSMAWMSSKEPMIICSSSGMLTSGRVMNWIKKILPDANSHIIFIGYASETSLAGRIRDERNNKTISVEGKAIKNRAGIVNLFSFSSHIQHDTMLKLYSEANFDKLALVHGNTKEKIKFASELQEEIQKKNNTGKVILPNKGGYVLL